MDRNQSQNRAWKVIFGCIAIIAGVLWVGITIYTSQSHSFGLIGGADGPTSVYLAGNTYGSGIIITAVIGGIVLAASGILLIVKNEKTSD